jgi:hypothetical protein
MEQFLAKMILEMGFFTVIYPTVAVADQNSQRSFLVPNCGLHQLAGHSRLYPPVRDQEFCLRCVNCVDSYLVE